MALVVKGFSSKNLKLSNAHTFYMKSALDLPNNSFELLIPLGSASFAPTHMLHFHQVRPLYSQALIGNNNLYDIKSASKGLANLFMPTHMSSPNAIDVFSVSFGEEYSRKWINYNKPLDKC